MRIDKIRVINFRSIVDETLNCENLTVLIGRNGSGKSSFLQALKLFMDTSATVSNEDYYNREYDRREINIEVSFSGLSDEEKNEFKSYLNGDSLVVQRRFPSAQYYGRVHGCPQLEPIREQLRQKGSKVADIAIKLKELTESGSFPGLKAVSQKIEEEVDRWEKENQGLCRDYFRSGIFLGPMNIAGGKLKSKTHFVYIPPVREADADASGSSKQSPLGTLIAPLLNLITDQNQDVKEVKQAVTEGFNRYKDIIQNIPERETLAQNLTAVLKRYDRETAASIRLGVDGTMNLPEPKPKVWLLEDGFEGEVSRKGNGLQRLFTFSILELYEVYRNRREGSGTDETIVLVVEEPELYQHPTRARSLARILRRLSSESSPGGFRFQILYSTHSPYFLSLGSFSNIRRIEKVSHAAGPMESKIKKTTLKQVGERVLPALKIQADPTDSSVWARLKSILGIKAAEGFFSDGVILVEGAEDEAILHAFLNNKGILLDQFGVSLISADGKTNLPWLLALYQQLGVPVYTIFDGDGSEPKDEDAKRNYNEALLELIGETRVAKPDTKIMTSGCVWKNTFAGEITNLFGSDKWNAAFQSACKEYEMLADHGRKKYAVVRRAVDILLDSDHTTPSIDQLLTAIISKFGIK